MTCYENKILECIESGNYTNEVILQELLKFLPEHTLKEFYETAFGNEGIKPIED